MAEQDNALLKLFGFELKRVQKKEKEKEKLPSIVTPTDEDGAGYVTASGSHYGQYIDLEGGKAKDNSQLIMKYRGVAEHPEVDAAIEDIVVEAVGKDEHDIAVLDLMVADVGVPRVVALGTALPREVVRLLLRQRAVVHFERVVGQHVEESIA